jgi:hypothetical protein
MSAACFSPRKILLALLFTLLPGCAAKPKPDADLVATAWDRKAELRKTCEELSGRPDFRSILGCSNIDAALGGTQAPK